MITLLIACKYAADKSELASWTAGNLYLLVVVLLFCLFLSPHVKCVVCFVAPMAMQLATMAIALKISCFVTVATVTGCNFGLSYLMWNMVLSVSLTEDLSCLRVFTLLENLFLNKL